MKRHFLFTSVPGFGHINPTLALVTELHDRGHRVSYAVGPDGFDAVRATGAELIELPTRMPDIRGLGPGMQITPERIQTMLSFFGDDLRQCLPILLERFSAEPPDAVCYDVMTMHGRMLADKLGVPAISLVPNFASNENFDLRQAVLAEHPAGPMPKPEDFAAMQRTFAEIGEEFGVEVPPFIGATPAALNLVFLPKQFQLSNDTFDERFRFIGPLLGDRGEQDYTPPDPGRRLLYISLGTAFNERPEFYRLCLQAFAESPCQVAMSVGKRIDIAELGDIPANFDVRPSFPQPAVLRQASAFVSHCGMNSTMESLYYGVPLIGVPQMHEQAANAARVEELGLGVRLDAETLTGAELRDAVQRVSTDETIRTNLADMREIQRATGGAPAGADAIEAFLP